MEVKDICLNVIAYILTATLLFYSAWSGFKNGNKFIAFITLITGIFVIWNAYENYKQIASLSTISHDNKNLLGSAIPI